jgi:hypothetical protein
LWRGTLLVTVTAKSLNPFKHGDNRRQTDSLHPTLEMAAGKITNKNQIKIKKHNK